ncbi:FecR family protein [Pedobacter caeni]|uniref:FecR family protein n=1 Tax=Pedobacter caeni TaxID=288992 RepID=A0A1M4UFI4_9SPHI|nr:FecR family protein [Pedobacter caeni]SHE55407.1 FecR family protein [Pedobacter caeni]
MLKEEFIRDILKRYQAGNCSPEEQQIIEDWYQERLDHAAWDFKPGDEPLIGTNIKNRIYKELALPENTTPGRGNRYNWFLIAGAAAILVCAVTTAIYFRAEKPVNRLVAKPELVKGLKGRQRHAVLTLANGETVLLNEAAGSQVIRQGDVEVKQTDKGKLTYNLVKNNNLNPVYNTLTTPKGTTYELQLPDGSRIWLNAASSITYPTAFSGQTRTVSVTGEVYFEVAPNVRKPFLVKTTSATIEVLGTHFNVNTYSNEPAMKTTLLEGKVKVTQNQISKVLEPGEQASIDQEGAITVLKEVNQAQVMGWKNGKFVLDKVDVHTLMRQVARWYDLEVIYKGKITQHFWGTVSQEMTAVQLFQMLESTGSAHFKLDGNKVIVSP